MSLSILNKNKKMDRGLLYAKTKIFRFKEKIDSLPRKKRDILAPIHVRIKPTNVCNHNCSYCAYRVDGLQLGRDMSERDFIPEAKMMEILEDLKNMGVKAVTFSGGGEPFCYPYLLNAVKFLTKTEIKFACLTNGSRLEGGLAEIFAQYATWLRISIDGWDEESYSSYRRIKKGEFTKVINNMRSFKKLPGKCYLGVSLVVGRDNAEHVFEFTKMLKDIGVDSVKVSPCIVSNDGQENNGYHRPFFNRVKDEIKKAKEDLNDDEFEIFDAYHEMDEKFKKDYGWCPYLQILPVIGADSNIYTCQDKAYNLDEGMIGSIKNVRFKDFWFSDKSKFFKVNPSRHCNHHCVANAKNRLILEYLSADGAHLDFV